MRVTILRGLPGSGKSTWAADNCPGAVILSTDSHHVDADGVYRFKRDRLAEFHNRTLRDAVHQLREGDHWGHLVIDNTNVRAFEIAPYYRLAEAFGHSPEIVWVHCDPEKAAARTVHGVPAELVRSMALSFDPLPSWWVVRHVYAG